jgi:hypothetical protein
MTPSSPFSEFLELHGDGTSTRTPGLAPLTLTPMEVGSAWTFALSGSFDLPANLGYGTGPFEIQTTMFSEVGISHADAMPTSYRVFAEAGSGTTLSYQIVSSDPGVSFTAVPEPGCSGACALLALAAVQWIRPRSPQSSFHTASAIDAAAAGESPRPTIRRRFAPGAAGVRT